MSATKRISRPSRRPLLVGLTGGIAAGKSVVAAMLQDLGAAVIDADRLARAVVEPGTTALAQIVAAFGSQVVDAQGRLNRQALGRIVFGNSAARRQLELITHPAIAAAFSREYEAHTRAGEGVVVYEAALLVETGRHVEMDVLVVVIADDHIQLERLAAREGIGPEEARRRLAAQLPQGQKTAVAHYVIDNSGSLQDTRRLVRRLWDDVLDPA